MHFSHPSDKYLQNLCSQYGMRHWQFRNEVKGSCLGSLEFSRRIDANRQIQYNAKIMKMEIYSQGAIKT